MTQAQIDALAGWGQSALFDARERTALRLADEVTRGPVASAARIDTLKQHFSAAEIVGLTLTASSYVCVPRFLQSTDVELEAVPKQA